MQYIRVYSEPLHCYAGGLRSPSVLVGLRDRLACRANLLLTTRDTVRWTVMSHTHNLMPAKDCCANTNALYLLTKGPRCKGVTG